MRINAKNTMVCVDNISVGKQAVILVEVEHKTAVITEIAEGTTNRISIDKQKHMNNTVKLMNKINIDVLRPTNNIIDKHMNRHKRSTDKLHMNNSTDIIMQGMDVCRDRTSSKLCLKSLLEMEGTDTMTIQTCTDKDRATMGSIMNTTNTTHLISMTHQTITINHNNSR